MSSSFGWYHGSFRLGNIDSLRPTTLEFGRPGHGSPGALQRPNRIPVDVETAKRRSGDVRSTLAGGRYRDVRKGLPGAPPSTWDLLRSTLDEGFRSIDRRLKECDPLQAERFNLKDADERLGAWPRHERFQL
jgi:hypothetical protein